MATVIDKLVVELGLEPKNLTAAQRQVLSDFKRNNEAIRTEASHTERSIEGNVEALSKLTRAFLAFLGVREVVGFGKELNKTNTEIAHLSKNIGESGRDISAWRNIATQMGGTAAGVAKNMTDIVGAVAHFKLTGQASEVFKYYDALGVSLMNAKGEARSFEEVMLDMAREMESGRAKGQSRPEKASMLGAMGLDPGVINAVLKGERALADMFRDQRTKRLISKEDEEAADKLARAWEAMSQSTERLGTAILTNISPYLKSLFDDAAKLNDMLTTAEGRQKLLKTINDNAFGGSKASQDVIGKMIAEAQRAYRGESPADKDFVDGRWLTDLFKALVTDPKPAPIIGGVAPGVTLGGSRPGNADLGSYGSSGQAGKDIAALMGMGWTKAQATGLVANFKQESAGRINAVGDGGAAYGLAQWHPDRQAEFKKWSGKDIRASNRDEQLAFVNYELREGKEKRAGDMLMRTKTAEDAASVASQFYERPANRFSEAAHRARLAQGLEQTTALPAIANATQGGLPPPGGGQQIVIQNMTVTTQATNAQDFAKDLRGALERDQLSSQANSGAN